MTDDATTYAKTQLAELARVLEELTALNAQERAALLGVNLEAIGSAQLAKRDALARAKTLRDALADLLDDGAPDLVSAARAAGEELTQSAEALEVAARAHAASCEALEAAARRCYAWTKRCVEAARARPGAGAGYDKGGRAVGAGTSIVRRRA